MQDLRAADFERGTSANGVEQVSSTLSKLT